MRDGFHPFTSPGPSDATTLQRPPPPSGRYSPPPVPPGGRPPSRRRPRRRLPSRGHRRDQGGLVRPDLHPAGDPLGLPRTGAQRRPVLPRRGGPIGRRSRSRGLQPCSSETGAYCQARKKLPEGFFAAVARRVGRNLDGRVERKWLWKGRRVHLFDGSSVMMPETPENRREYPLTYNQTQGGAFPVARIAAVDLALVRSDPRPRDLPIRRQRAERIGAAPERCGGCSGQAT